MPAITNPVDACVRGMQGGKLGVSTIDPDLARCHTLPGTQTEALLTLSRSRPIATLPSIATLLHLPSTKTETLLTLSRFKPIAIARHPAATGKPLPICP